MCPHCLERLVRTEQETNVLSFLIAGVPAQSLLLQIVLSCVIPYFLDFL